MRVGIACASDIADYGDGLSIAFIFFVRRSGGSLLLEFSSLMRYMTIYMVRSVAWVRSIWRTPRPI